ncbi:DNA-binding GntR family transcriptional regulator [Kibdelosporangium banguiense]|uniref:DNA-binding GntR family transcriptional regulator n=1 Tax=Kibdelosporangium banguiense TaxID=1365924 RepID=A0ABS4TAG7_9PSEU|nr:GntR family transcriptional regulator [Kibdelosporangium banguiense]MBP2321402.1 DNA-binding GntR family transcriptional regulator [Kibdelosporangium banguiense]
MAKLDPNNASPPYVQVTEGFRAAIANGIYAPGDKLPSYDAAAEEWGVAVGTVKRAFGALQQEGLITTRHGTGSFVHPDLDPSHIEITPDRPVTVQAADIREVLRLLTEINDRLVALERRMPSGPGS